MVPAGGSPTNSQANSIIQDSGGVCSVAQRPPGFNLMEALPPADYRRAT